MNWNSLFFVILPYVAMSIGLTATVYRAVFRPFSISSLSSQLLERRKLYWGSVSFHWGITLVLLGHVLAMLIPALILWWNASPLRLYLLELTGFALALWALVGLIILGARRLGDPRVGVVTSAMDIGVWVLLLLSIITGLVVASRHRFGSYWFTSIFTPYLWSLLEFRPRPELVQPLPVVIKVHVISFFLLLIIFPFSRLIHIITLPVNYLIRPWQIVTYVRRRKEWT